LFWHSQANNVYASECENGVLPQTVTLMSTYATAAGYGAVASFDAYPVTGDAEGWLASMGIPAVTVEFGSHESSEWAKNLAGTQAVIRLYSQIQ
jgi:predicted deacylase